MKEETINIDNLSITELKAMIYDFNAAIQQAQNNIKIVNEAIAKKYEEQNKPKEDK